MSKYLDQATALRRLVAEESDEAIGIVTPIAPDPEVPGPGTNGPGTNGPGTNGVGRRSAGPGHGSIGDPGTDGPVPAGRRRQPAAATRRPASDAGAEAARSTRPRLARTLAVVSGKGGVGKSNIAVNLAIAFTQMGRKVCLLDGDLGMANVDVLCNLSPKLTLQHVVTGRCSLPQVMMLGPGGFRLIPGASGVSGMADLGPERRRLVLEELVALERVADLLIVDCAAGISANVLAFAAAAHTTLVTTTTEPPAISDAYGMIKSLVRKMPGARVQLVVNMAHDRAQAVDIHRRMNLVTQRFLDRSIGFAGAIPIDAAVPRAVFHRLPFTLMAPKAPATEAMFALARRLGEGDRSATTVTPRGGFFSRLTSFLGGSRSTHGVRE